MAQIKIPKFASTQRELTYNDFSGGLNYQANASLILPSQSPEMQNCRVRDNTVSKRPGYSRMFPASLGPGKINGLFQYKKANGESFTLIAHGGNLFIRN